MKAPCGVEIKVGQIWKLGKNGVLVTIVETPELERQSVSARQLDTGWETTILLSNMTGKRGGYRLVRDVEGECKS